MRSDLAALLRQRRGHFELESGHHGSLWLDLESLCSRPAAVRPLAVELAERLRPYDVEIVCGPLVEGAFVGLLVAEELDAEFVYAEREPGRGATTLFPVSYRIPQPRRSLRNRRAAIANDVINAGSAVRGALKDLQCCRAEVVAIGALLSLGSGPALLAREASVPLETLDALPNSVWDPSDCPLCASGAPLTPFPGQQAAL